MSSVSNVWGFASKRWEVCLGLSVLPRYFSPEGDLGGVCFGEFLAWMFEINIGEGGAVSWEVG